MKERNALAITGLGLEMAWTASLQDMYAMLQCSDPLPGNNFQPENTLGKRGLRYKDPATQMALCASHRALHDAGFTVTSADRTAPYGFGVATSSNMGNIETICTVLNTIRKEGACHTSPMALPICSANIIASDIAIRFGLKGINLTICNGGTSGIDALYLASVAIRAGRAERILVVGVEPYNNIVEQLARDSSGAHHRWIVHGQGAGAMVVESLCAARRRDAQIYGVIGRFSLQTGPEFESARIFKAVTDDGSPWLWLIPNTKFPSANAYVETTRRNLPGELPVMMDVSARFDELYGALGIIQCIVACMWFQQDQGSKAIASSGLSYGASVSSVELSAAPEVN